VKRILIVDDHAVVRRGMIQILEDTGDKLHLGEASDGVEAMEKIRSESWDVVLLDVAMPGRSGADVLKQIKQEYPKLPVLVLSMYPEDQYAVRLVRAGASGYMTKESAPELLADAVRMVSVGKKYISPKVAELLAETLAENLNDVEGDLHARLSDREFHVFLQIAGGKGLSDIARELSLSVKTIASYRSRILEKLRLKTNADLTLYASKHDLINNL